MLAFDQEICRYRMLGRMKKITLRFEGALELVDLISPALRCNNNNIQTKQKMLMQDFLLFVYQVQKYYFFAKLVTARKLKITGIS